MEKGPVLNVTIEGRKLRDVLDDLVKQDPRYEWRIIDGAINVLPRSQHDLVVKSILEARVEELTLPKETNLYSLRHALVQTETVKSQLQQANVEDGVISFTRFGSLRLDSELLRTISKLTIRQILNRVITTSAAKYWIVGRYGKNKEFFVLNF